MKQEFRYDVPVLCVVLGIVLFLGTIVYNILVLIF
jgi:hypothetical protein